MVMNMNNKLLVELIVPRLEEKFEIFIPINKRMFQVVKLIEKALNEITNGYYPIGNDSVIIDGESGNVYDMNIIVKETKMINGSKIILL